MAERREIVVFGRRLLLEREAGLWTAFDPGADGKRQVARDIRIPGFIATDTELAQFLADVLHERATPSNAVVEWVR